MTWLTLIIIAAVTLITQCHGTRFWIEQTGPIGWGWSITLEAVALWLWYQGNRRALAIVASCLLLAGPMYQITAPLFAQSNHRAITETTRLQQLDLLRQQIATLQQAHASALRNSEARPGWLNEIQSTRADLIRAQGELATLTAAQQPDNRAALWTKTIMQAFALLTLWLASISAINTLTQSRQPPATATPAPRARITHIKHPTSAATPPTDPRSALAKQITTALDAHITARGISQNQWADANNVPRKQLSLIRNHDDRASQGTELASIKKMEQIAALLGIGTITAIQEP